MRVLTEEIITAFERELRSEEKSANTVEKYLRDVRRRQQQQKRENERRVFGGFSPGELFR